MRWSPYIIGPWVARVPADHACRTITRADEMKRKKMDEMSMEKWWNEICGRGKREKPREKPTQTPFRPPRNPRGETETRTRDPSGGRRAANRLRHEAAWFLYTSTNFNAFYFLHLFDVSNKLHYVIILFYSFLSFSGFMSNTSLGLFLLIYTI